MDKEIFDKNWALNAGINLQILKELGKAFISSLDFEFALINSGIASGDLDCVQRATHKLKGAALQIGAMRIGFASAEFNNYCKKLIDSIISKLQKRDIQIDNSSYPEQFMNFGIKNFDYIHRGEENKAMVEYHQDDLKVIANELYSLFKGKDVEVMKSLSDRLLKEINLFKEELKRL